MVRLVRLCVCQRMCMLPSLAFFALFGLQLGSGP